MTSQGFRDLATEVALKTEQEITYYLYLALKGKATDAEVVRMAKENGTKLHKSLSSFFF